MFIGRNEFIDDFSARPVLLCKMFVGASRMMMLAVVVVSLLGCEKNDKSPGIRGGRLPTYESCTVVLRGGVEIEMVNVAPNPITAMRRSHTALGESVPCRVDPFWMGKYEVTQALWTRVMGENPSRFNGADLPADNVSYYDCQAFIDRLNSLPEVKASGFAFRIPTEEEWKYECSADERINYYRLMDGTEVTEETLDDAAWYMDNSGNESHPVGQKKPNIFGLYDLLGNVSEWTQSTCADLRGNENALHINCGGNFTSTSRGCESSSVCANAPSSRWDHGLRLCASKSVR